MQEYSGRQMSDSEKRAPPPGLCSSLMAMGWGRGEGRFKQGLDSFLPKNLIEVCS